MSTLAKQVFEQSSIRNKLGKPPPPPVLPKTWLDPPEVPRVTLTLTSSNGSKVEVMSLDDDTEASSVTPSASSSTYENCGSSAGTRYEISELKMWHLLARERQEYKAGLPARYRPVSRASSVRRSMIGSLSSDDDDDEEEEEEDVSQEERVPSASLPDDFESRYRDMGEALSWLSTELANLRAQDKDLVRELLDLRATIRHVRHTKLINMRDEPWLLDDSTGDAGYRSSLSPIDFDNEFRERTASIDIIPPRKKEPRNKFLTLKEQNRELMTSDYF